MELKPPEKLKGGPPKLTNWLNDLREFALGRGVISEGTLGWIQGPQGQFPPNINPVSANLRRFPINIGDGDHSPELNTAFTSGSGRTLDESEESPWAGISIAEGKDGRWVATFGTDEWKGDGPGFEEVSFINTAGSPSVTEFTLIKFPETLKATADGVEESLTFDAGGMAAGGIKYTGATYTLQWNTSPGDGVWYLNTDYERDGKVSEFAGEYDDSGTPGFIQDDGDSAGEEGKSIQLADGSGGFTNSPNLSLVGGTLTVGEDGTTNGGVTLESSTGGGGATITASGGGVVFSGTAGATIPTGTTGERVASEGTIRVNSTLGTTEIYRNAGWQDLEAGGVGTVTSVGQSVPTGLTVSGSPITGSGTLAITFTAGYSIPTDAKQTQWDTAYSWGDHSAQSYLTASSIDSLAELNAIVLDATLDDSGDSRPPNGSASGDLGGSYPAPTLNANLSSLLDFFNGTFLETFDATVSSDGATITLSLEQDGTGDLTMVFSDGFATLDCTPAQTVTLTAGSATVPQENYSYILRSTKALTNSTTGWPATEHIKVAYTVVRTAALENGAGPLVNQNWNDHSQDSTGQGHLSHITEKIRRSAGGSYVSGCALTPTITTAGSPDQLDIAVAAGVVLQMHEQTFPAFDTATGDQVFVVNHNSTPYTETSDLETAITSDSGGTSLANKFFNCVFFGVANKGDESYSPVMCNLPSGGYNTLADAQADVDSQDVYTIPDYFSSESSTGFLISRETFKFAAGTNVLTSEASLDLRGFDPFSAGSAGGVSSAEFPDSTFRIQDNSDATKEIAFEASGITTGTTRTITAPDKDITLSDGSDHERGGSDEIDGDHLDIDFTPANYTPSTSPAEAANVDDLAAHLAGIDDGLGSVTPAMVQVATATASSDATVDFTGLDSTYRAYKLVGNLVVPATDAVNALVRISISGVFKTASYRRAVFRTKDSATNSTEGSTGAGAILLASSVGSAAGEGISFEMTIPNPSNATIRKQTFGSVTYETSTASVSHVIFGGVYTGATSAIDGVRFMFAAGLVESGEFVLYGLI